MIMTPVQTEISIHPCELQRRLGTGQPACLLDVRTPGEYATAHVPGTRLIPLDKLDAAAFCRDRGGDCAPVYVLCQSGGRARRAITKLEQAGVKGCVLVDGGTQAWIEAGLPVNRGTRRVTLTARLPPAFCGLWFFRRAGPAIPPSRPRRSRR